MYSFGKLVEASPVNTVCGDAKSQNNDKCIIGNGDHIISGKNSLIWITACLDVQDIPAMIDSGANPNCISLRCVQGSEYLKGLKRHSYSGKRIVDANGEPIQPSFVIKCKLIVGCPKIAIETDFVVIQSLPFSCIIGQRTLQTFSTWEVSNTNKLLTINKIHKVPFVTVGATFNNNNKVQLITTQKTVIQPFMSTMVNVKASGPALNAFRPSSSIDVLMEGNPHVCERLSVEVLPAINVLTYQNCKQKLKVHNVSPYPKTIAKGVNIATCSMEFEQCDMQVQI